VPPKGVYLGLSAAQGRVPQVLLEVMIMCKSESDWGIREERDGSTKCKGWV
jgi:hypothetical protein